MSISPQVFHSLLFCPGVATALGTTVSNLPTSCGSSGGFDKDGATITSIADSFAQGHIDINGSITKSGFCYDASGTFHGALSLAISNSTLIPSIAIDDPDVDVDIPWYCWLAAGLILGPLGILITGIINVIAENVANDIAQSAVNGALGNGLGGFSMGNLGGASFNAVSITTEGLTLEGNAPFISIPSPKPVAFWIDGSTITQNKTSLSTGTYHVKWPIICGGNEEDYPYTEYAQLQKAVYTAYSYMLTPPLTLAWEIRVPKPGNIGADVYPLTGNSGTISFPAKTDYPLPLPGGSSVQQMIHIGYSISGATVILTNSPAEGNYSYPINVKATDCSGDVEESGDWFTFNGDIVEIGGTYYQDQQACWSKMTQWIKGHLKQAAQKEFPPDLIGPINYPPEEQIVESIYELIALNMPEADSLLLNMKLSYGSTFYRGLYSREASQIGLSKEVKAGLSAKAQVAVSELNILNSIKGINASKEIQVG